MKQYLDLLQNIKDNGVEKESGRANMPNTVGISFGVIQMDLKDGYPLLTTKKMFWKGIVHELLWILRGDTNIKYLVDNGVNVWNKDAYGWYLKYCDKMGIEESERFNIEEFVETIKADNLDRFSKSSTGIPDHLLGSVMPMYYLGDLGKVYGYQWRHQNGVDQVKECLEGLQTNPYSRYQIINGWNKADQKHMALPPCHLLYQFIVRPIDYMQRTDLAWKMGFEAEYRAAGAMLEADWQLWFDEKKIPKFYLDLNMYQRSCDTMLGVPFNIASMSLLLKIFARACNMLEGISTWIGGDTHLYVNHLELVNEQLSRKPYPLPQLFIKKELHTLEDIMALTIEDFELVRYKSHPKIDAELFTGLKK